MRHVFGNDMVAHVWAQQNQDTGRNGKDTVSFDGTAFYSYSTPIANFVTDRHGVRVCLITDNSYSSTTGGHIMMARRAVEDGSYGDGPNTFTVCHLGVEGGRSARLRLPFDISDETRALAPHVANVTAMLANYAEAVAKAKRKLAHRYGMDRSDFDNKVERIRQYADRFNVADVALPDVAADWQAIEAAEAKRNTPEAVAKRAKSAAKRIERSRADFREVRGLYGEHFRGYFHGRAADDSIFTPEDRKARADKLGDLNQARIDDARENYRNGTGGYDVRYYDARHYDVYAEYFTDDDKAARDVAVAATLETLRTAYRTVVEPYGIGLRGTHNPDLFTADDKAARTARIAEIDADKIAAWRQGTNVHLAHDYDAGALLRLSRDGKTVETSWGANFPVEHGTRAFPAINRVREAGREYVANGHKIHLGHFVIDRVTAEGDVFAGCHHVKWAEVAAVANALDLIAA